MKKEKTFENRTYFVGQIILLKSKPNSLMLSKINIFFIDGFPSLSKNRKIFLMTCDEEGGGLNPLTDNICFRSSLMVSIFISSDIYPFPAFRSNILFMFTSKLLLFYIVQRTLVYIQYMHIACNCTNQLLFKMKYIYLVQFKERRKKYSLSVRPRPLPLATKKTTLGLVDKFKATN